MFFKRVAKKPQVGIRADGILITALLAAIATLGVLFVVFVPTLYDRTRIDPVTLCSDDRLIHHTVIVIDTSDPLSAGQADAMASVLRDVRDGLLAGQRLSVFRLDGSAGAGLSKPLFSKCKPKLGREANWLMENAAFLQNRYLAAFVRPLEDVIAAETASNVHEERSPIAEAISDVPYQDGFSRRVASRKLIVFSDMLQHSSVADHYAIRSAMITQRQEENLKRALADLTDVDVEVFYILRDPSKGGVFQGENHLFLWRSYFQAAHVRSLSIKELR